MRRYPATNQDAISFYYGLPTMVRKWKQVVWSKFKLLRHGNNNVLGIKKRGRQKKKKNDNIKN